MAADLFASNEIVSRSNVNDRITAINNMFPVSVANGGTGGTSTTAARTNLEVMTGVQLYYNASGNSGTVALADTIQNYKCIQITIKNYDGYKLGFTIWNEFSDNESSCMTINTPTKVSNVYQISVQSRVMQISGDTITWGDGAYAVLKNNTAVYTNNEASIAIIKVVGYKY